MNNIFDIIIVIISGTAGGMCGYFFLNRINMKKTTKLKGQIKEKEEQLLKYAQYEMQVDEENLSLENEVERLNKRCDELTRKLHRHNIKEEQEHFRLQKENKDMKKVISMSWMSEENYNNMKSVEIATTALDEIADHPEKQHMTIIFKDIAKKASQEIKRTT